MFNILQLFLIILIGCLQLAFQGAIILILFKKEVNIKKVLVYSLAFTLLHQLPISFFPINNTAISLVLYIIISILSIKFILKFNYIHSFFAATILFVISIIIEYIGMAILKISFGNSFDSLEWSKSFSAAIMMRALGIFLIFLVFMIIYYFKIQLQIPEDMNKKRILGVIISVLMTFLLVIPNILFFLQTIPSVSTSVYFFNAISLLFFLFFNIYSSLKLSELDAKSQQVEFQNLYINTLNDTINGLRGFKHDFNNIIQVIDGYLKLNNIEGLKKYHKQILGEVRKINNTMPLNSYLKNFPALYGLLLSKLSYSEVKDITFNINILSEIDIKNVKTLDFCKVIGILLDNALEAAAECEEKIVELIINRNNNDNITIEISNSYVHDIDIQKIFESGFTTKKDHSGFGLFEVQKILRKYNNVFLDTSVKDNYFTQKLIIS